MTLSDSPVRTTADVAVTAPGCGLPRHAAVDRRKTATAVRTKTNIHTSEARVAPNGRLKRVEDYGAGLAVKRTTPVTSSSGSSRSRTVVPRVSSRVTTQTPDSKAGCALVPTSGPMTRACFSDVESG